MQRYNVIFDDKWMAFDQNDRCDFTIKEAIVMARNLRQQNKKPIIINKHTRTHYPYIEIVK